MSQGHMNQRIIIGKTMILHIKPNIYDRELGSPGRGLSRYSIHPS